MLPSPSYGNGDLTPTEPVWNLDITVSADLNKLSFLQVTVLGEVKIVGLLILSAIILPGESSQFTAKMTVGCVLAMLGFCLYSNTKLVMARRAAAGQGQPAKQAKQSSEMEEGQALLQVLLLPSNRHGRLGVTSCIQREQDGQMLLYASIAHSLLHHDDVLYFDMQSAGRVMGIHLRNL